MPRRRGGITSQAVVPATEEMANSSDTRITNNLAEISCVMLELSKFVRQHMQSTSPTVSIAGPSKPLNPTVVPNRLLTQWTSSIQSTNLLAR